MTAQDLFATPEPPRRGMHPDRAGVLHGQRNKQGVPVSLGCCTGQRGQGCGGHAGFLPVPGHAQAVGGAAVGAAVLPAGLLLRRRGWPKDGYTLLCWNCNAMTRFGRTCPHEEA